jgi:hypothetical protein
MAKLVACALLALPLHALAGCGPNHTSPPDAFEEEPPTPDAHPDAPGNPDAAPLPDGDEPFMGWVYSHSSNELFRVDPHTLEVTSVGLFGWPAGMENELMTDLAVDKEGHLTGVSFGAVYAVDADTAACTYLSTLSRTFNGLSYVPASELGARGDDILVGTTLDGSIWRVDPITGGSEEIGNFGGGYISSGDIVSVDGFGTVATVNLNNEEAIDLLARVDLLHGGTATIIGSTNMYDLWGVGFWGGKVYGFAATNEFVELDTTTGAATLIHDGTVNWWGAAVTTIAPTVPD